MPDKYKKLFLDNIGVIRDYSTLVGGSAGRLVISLVYFIALANTLSISDFGLFASASASGIMLSRLMAFGFVSPVYRIATVKHHLLGTYTSGLLAGSIISLPLILIAGYIFYLLFFSDQTSIFIFALIVAAEVICWRAMEIVVIVCNGLNRFARGSLLVVLATLMKTIAAVAFSFFSDGSLGQWGLYYIIANGVSALIAIIWFYPKVKLRWKLSLYLGRWLDAVSVASAEMLFYVQSELDKLLVLAIGGAQIAGIYAILMRLVDLTALPVRAALTLIVQKIMRSTKAIQSIRNRIFIEFGIAFVSCAGLGSMIIFLWIFPNALGENVATATPYLAVILLVPVFRNIIEYHSELLYATKQTVIRTINLVILGVLKAGFLFYILDHFADDNVWIWQLNYAFGALYLVSAALTYVIINMHFKRTIQD